MQNPTKVVQAYIQGLLKASDLIKQADNLCQELKTKFVTKNLDLTGTNVTPAQITAVNNFITELNNLRNNVVITTIDKKDIPSHGIEALN